MSYDLQRFVDQKVASRFVCSICEDVLCSPQVNKDSPISRKEPENDKVGGHKFCEECISKWLESSNTCPICRQEINSLKSWKNYAPKKLKELRIRCKYVNKGCKFIGIYQSIEQHELEDCLYNGKAKKCKRCGLQVSNLNNHTENDCIRELHEIIKELDKKTNEQDQTIKELGDHLNTSKNELTRLKKSSGESEQKKLMMVELRESIETKNERIEELEHELDIYQGTVERSEDLNQLCCRQDNPINRVKEIVNSNAPNVIINFKGEDGYTPLLNASRRGHFDVVKHLIRNGANVNYKSQNGYTALIFASSGNHVEIVELLIENGADINAKDDNGSTVLISASGEGYQGIIKVLISHGARVNEADNLGFTALMSASYYGHLSIIKFLLRNNADINQKDNRNKTAFDYAKTKEIEKYLKSISKSVH